MSEAQMWKYLKPKLEPVAEAIRLTDRHLKGLPDLLIAERSTGLTGLVEMKFIKEGARKIGLRQDQALFAWNWAKVGYAGILVREGQNWWHYLRPGPDVDWLTYVTGSKNVWRELLVDCTTGYDVSTHGPSGLADWLLSNLFDR